MKRLLLFICLLFTLLFPAQTGRTGATICMATEQPSLFETELHSEWDTDTDGGEITQTELQHSTGEFLAGHCVPVPVQQRQLASRPAPRTVTQIWAMRQLRTLTLPTDLRFHQLYRTYTTLKIPNWQYAADNYVFAYRHIII